MQSSQQQSQPVRPPASKAESKGLLSSTLLVSSMTMLSRVMGFARDIILARLLGGSPAADAFFVAFKIPNFMRRLFAEGAFSQAFVPVLSQWREEGGKAAVRDLVAHSGGTLALILFVVNLIAVIAAPLLVTVFAPGFIDQPEKFELAGQLLRVTFPYLMLISLTAFCGAILNTWGKFGIPAFTPVLLNISLIIAALVFAPGMEQPVVALAWGVFVAGIAQLLFQLPFVWKLGLLPKLKWGGQHKGVKQILTLMIPALFGVSVGQINLLLDTLLASFLQDGSISWLYFSDRLMEFPLGVFGVALATVVLPHLSRTHTSGDTVKFSASIDWSLRMVFLIGLPAALGLGLLAEPMLATLFQYGAFTDHDVLMAARSLRAYSLGLLVFILVKVLANGFYARQDMKTPVRIAIIAMVVNMAFNLALIFPLQHAGLALATSLSAIVNAGLLWHGLAKSGVWKAAAGWGVFILRLLLALFTMGFILLWFTPESGWWLAQNALNRGLWLTGLIGGGALGYFCVLLISGLRVRHIRAPM
ncbi:murein biosynthesis integral membrane protein MurJ [Pelagibaculum spongiae]|uniref:Probable lipid II flippase MurJ n=1 Tax=Pelagibaculum spongiae TaxID=2080658 RepID=A0A2V1GXE2_9GAMM|nr:murein biosynthesis integral membrane protein MurJ [Pelagibaculum spongiae]PVZ70690.1 murein biosynthesis integral membrane protein MurJ [Pelagibaculum spongiae]